MPGNRNFWRNVAIIGAAHIVAIVGIVRWNAAAKQAAAQNIVWVNGDLADGGGASGPPSRHDGATTPELNEPEVTPSPVDESREDQMLLASAKSEIQLPEPTTTPTPTPAPTAKPSVSPVVKTPPRPSPKPPKKPRPRPTPRPTPKPTPKPKPRTVLAKASPKPTVQPEVDSEEDADTKEAEKPDGENPDTKSTEHEGSAVAAPGSGSGHGSGMGKASQFASYGKMLHDRFYSEWDQPTSSVAAATRISTMVRVRIEKNGRVSAFEIIRPSGNVLIDDSVAQIGKRVSRVDPLPAGLGSSGHYDVKINFELNTD